MITDVFEKANKEKIVKGKNGYFFFTEPKLRWIYLRNTQYLLTRYT